MRRLEFGHDVPVDSFILLWTMAKSLLLIRLPQEIVNIAESELGR
jgi:hypothetical protein